MSEVEYFSIDGVRGDYFKCERLRAKLSTAACSKLYQQAMSPRGLETGQRLQCRGCPLGASHSGASPLVASNSRFLGQLICSRCHENTRRLIRKSICVSCYNREREVMIGKNAKGGAPIHCRKVSSTTLACVMGEVPAVKVRRFDRVSSPLEAVLSTIRLETQVVSFGWIAPPIVRGGVDAGSRS